MELQLALGAAEFRLPDDCDGSYARWSIASIFVAFVFGQAFVVSERVALGRPVARAVPFRARNLLVVQGCRCGVGICGGAAGCHRPRSGPASGAGRTRCDRIIPFRVEVLAAVVNGGGPSEIEKVTTTEKRPWLSTGVFWICPL